MKVLIVNAYDIEGGAARAANRLHESLLNEGLDSQMLTIEKKSDDFRVIEQFNKKQKFFNKVQQVFINFWVKKKYKNKTKTFFTNSWMPFSNFENVVNLINPDIVHLHWVSKGVLRVNDLKKIKSPIVWSLHDMWAFTGGCHYDEGCNRYIDTCGKCIVLRSEKIKDLSKKNQKQKRDAYSQVSNLTIVGLSKWLEKSAKESSLFKDINVINLPNPINTNIFKPFDKIKSRELWGLPKSKKLLMFGAMSSTSDKRKGFIELKEALFKIKDKNFELVVFGSSKPKVSEDLGYKTHYVGTLSDNLSLVTLYNAVDAMIVPSLQENLSNTIMESLACGTPVIGFDIGGNKDMIEHKKNGYLAKPNDISDLAKGIEWLIYNENYDTFKKNATDKVNKEFEMSVVARKYINLYEELIR